MKFAVLSVLTALVIVTVAAAPAEAVACKAVGVPKGCVAAPAARPGAPAAGAAAARPGRGVGGVGGAGAPGGGAGANKAGIGR